MGFDEECVQVFKLIWHCVGFQFRENDLIGCECHSPTLGSTLTNQLEKGRRMPRYLKAQRLTYCRQNILNATTFGTHTRRSNKNLVHRFLFIFWRDGRFFIQKLISTRCRCFGMLARSVRFWWSIIKRVVALSRSTKAPEDCMDARESVITLGQTSSSSCNHSVSSHCFRLYFLILDVYYSTLHLAVQKKTMG